MLEQCCATDEVLKAKSFKNAFYDQGTPPQDPVLFLGSMRSNVDPLGRRNGAALSRMLRQVLLGALCAISVLHLSYSDFAAHILCRTQCFSRAACAAIWTHGGATTTLRCGTCCGRCSWAAPCGSWAAWTHAWPRQATTSVLASANFSA